VVVMDLRFALNWFLQGSGQAAMRIDIGTIFIISVPWERLPGSPLFDVSPTIGLCVNPRCHRIDRLVEPFAESPEIVENPAPALHRIHAQAVPRRQVIEAREVRQHHPDRPLGRQILEAV
jgi:hypothetical protein